MSFPKAMSAVLVLLSCSLACGQTIKLPAAVSTDPGTPAALIADADGKNVAWMSPDKGITIIDGGFFGGDSKRAMVFGSIPGTYRVWAVTAKGDVVSPVAVCLVTINGNGPGPVPPVPPGPNPVPPEPLTPLAQSIKAAAAADGFTKLAELSQGLTAAEAISKSRASWTVADLSAAWQAAMRSAVGGPTPPTLRKVLGDLLNAALPRESEHVMTTEEMSKARELILKLAKACTEASR